MGWSRTAEGLASGGRQVSWWALRFRMPELDLRRNQRRVATGNPPMSRLHTALLLLTDDCTGSDLAVILDIPKRTADRWLAELRAGELGNWHAGAIEALAAHEAHPAAPPARQLPTPGSYALPPLRAAPDGLVRDEQGKVRPLHDLLAGRIVVLSFIYTRCADGAGCPMASYTLSQAAGRLAKSGELGSRVAFLSVSFDPAHDSPEVLAAYAGHFQKPGIDWRFMATDPASMGQLLGAYRQDVVKGGDDASLAHTLRVFLIDAAGQIRNEYTAGFLDAGLLATDVQTLALETASKAETPPRPTPASTGTGDPRAGYQSGAYRSGSRALLARQGVPLALAGNAGPAARRRANRARSPALF